MDKKCFVIMPFKDELKSLFTKLKSICKELKIDCRRSDEIAQPNVFLLPPHDIEYSLSKIISVINC